MLIDSFRTHLGQSDFQHFGPVGEPLLAGGAALAVYWLLLFWMHRRRIYIRI